TMRQQIREHLKHLGPQRARAAGAGQGIELGIEDTIGEVVAHGEALRTAACRSAGAGRHWDVPSIWSIPGPGVGRNARHMPASGQGKVRYAVPPPGMLLAVPQRALAGSLSCPVLAGGLHDATADVPHRALGLRVLHGDGTKPVAKKGAMAS